MQSKLSIHCLSNVTGLVKLVGVEWYCGGSGYNTPDSPSLVIVFDNGRAQLMRHELDDSKWGVGVGRGKGLLLSISPDPILLGGGGVREGTPVIYSPPDPILLETRLNVTCVQWNHNGSLLAFGGTQKFQDGKELCSVQFYSAHGQVSMMSSL